MSQTGSSEQKEIKSRDSIPLLFNGNKVDVLPANYASINNVISMDSNDSSYSSKSKPKLKGESSITGVGFNLLNALVGAGILAIPDAYSKCGVFGGVGLMTIFAVICTYTLNLLIIAGHRMNIVNYEDLGYECYGYFGFFSVSLCMFLLDYGVLLTCLIIIGDCGESIASIWGFNSYVDRQIIILLIAFFIIFPLCLRRDIAHIELFSFFKICALILVTVVIIYECIKHFMHSNIPMYKQHIMWFDINGIPFALGICAFSFVCHDTAFLYYNSLKDPTTMRWTKLSLGGISSAMIVSIILSIPAYLTFTDNIEGNLLNNYQVDNGLIILIRVLYVIVMALTYPIPLFVARHVCYAIYIRYKNKNKHIDNFENEVNENVKHASLLHHVLLSSVIFFSTVTISMFVDNLGIAMSIIGSLSSVNLAFVFPCVFYIKVVEYKWSFWKAKTVNDACIQFLGLYVPLFLAIFGAFIGVYSVVITVASQNKGQ